MQPQKKLESISSLDISSALKTNFYSLLSSFYETQSETAKRNFFAFFGEEEYIYSMRRIIKEVITCENTK